MGSGHRHGRRARRRSASLVGGALLSASLLLTPLGCSNDEPPAASGSGDAVTTTTASTPSSTTSTSSAPATSAPETGAATKAEFIEEADAVCKEMNEQVAQAGEPKPTSTAASVAFLDKTLVAIDQALVKLRALPAPAGDAATLQAVFAQVDAMTVLMGQFRDAVAAEDKPRAQALEKQLDDASKAANKASADYGMVECAK